MYGRRARLAHVRDRATTRLGHPVSLGEIPREESEVLLEGGLRAVVLPHVVARAIRRTVWGVHTFWCRSVVEITAERTQ